MGKTKSGKASPAPEQPAIYYSLHTLLETIRLIKKYEDPLCTLLHAIQTSGGAGFEVEQELQTLLDEMPSEAYPLELHALRDTLGRSLPVTAHSGSETPDKPQKSRSRLPSKRASGNTSRQADK